MCMWEILKLVKKRGQGKLYDGNGKILQSGKWKDNNFLGDTPATPISENKGNDSEPAPKLNPNDKDVYSMTAYSMLMMVFLEIAAPRTDDKSLTKMKFNLNRVWDDKSVYSIQGSYRDQNIELSIRSLWSDKSEWTLDGKLDSSKINLDFRDIWRNKIEYSLKGTIGSVSITNKVKDLLYDGMVQSYKGTIGPKQDYLQLNISPDNSKEKILLFGTYGDQKIKLTAFPKAAIGEENIFLLRVKGNIGLEQIDIEMKDVFNDGSRLDFRGTIQ